MHAILQKHHLRPATQPSSSRGKPAASVLPPPCPSAPRLPSRQRPDDELVVNVDHADTTHRSRVRKTTPAHGEDCYGTRIVHSSSGRKFYLSSVEDLLQPLPPPAAEGDGAGGVSQRGALPPRPATQGTASVRSAGPSDFLEGSMPRLASAATGDLPGCISNMEGGEMPLHHALAQEIARMARRLPFIAGGGADASAQTYEQPPGSRGSPTGSWAGERFHAPDRHGHFGASHDATSRRRGSPTNQWATFAADASSDELCSLLKVVLIQLLSIGGDNAPQSSSQPPKTTTSRLRVSQQKLSASDVFAKVCSIFAEATGEVPVSVAARHATARSTHGAGEDAGDTRRRYGARPQQPERPPTTDDTASICGSASSPAADPDDDGVQWQTSPRVLADDTSTAFGNCHASVRVNRKSLMIVGNHAQDNNALASDAVLFRQIGILRRERDGLRYEVQALRAELQRQLEPDDV